MMRLCFGTFAQVLRLCRLDGVTDKQLVGTMTRTLDPDCQYIEKGNDTSVSRLFSCTGNLSPGRSEGGSGAYKAAGDSLSNVIQLARTVKTADVAQRFHDNVLPLIDEDKKVVAVLALRDIIRNDTTLDDEKVRTFEKYLGTTKKALLSQSEVVLPFFLAGVFLYTVNAVKNTVGKECIGQIDSNYIQSFRDQIWLITMVDRPKSNKQVELNTVVATQTQQVEPDYSVYLRNAKSKYSTVKTLLYSDQPRPFYDFYVCNNIERRIYTSSRFGTSYQTKTISNATATLLSDCSKFVILSGTGGLGKSMMMRHLLLDSIENHDVTTLIPVFIPLKDYDASSNGLLEYVYGKLDSLGGGITKTQFENSLVTGGCLLLFDGLDEISSSYGKRFEQELEAFTDKYPNNLFVISSRPYSSFVSFSRFTVLQLRPFSKQQALQLVDNLEFRPDEPAIKNKFRDQLDQTLYQTHYEFSTNPLLLTIMLMTFEQFAEVPSKMHIFYQEAFLALSQKHDASKGAYKRTLKTGLTADRFSDCFAEICSRSYHDEKFELSETEFAQYYDVLKERQKSGDQNATAADFLYDLCSNMCLMYYESGKYHFTHRSFQEYFCALYFSKQKDKNLKSIGDFFEYKRRRTYGDKTFSMLYDMIPEKVEEYIFVPFLTTLFQKCDEGDGYWTFLEEMYPCISYEKGETNEFISNDPESFIFEFLRMHKGIWDGSGQDDMLPFYEALVRDVYVYVEDEDGNRHLVNRSEVDNDYEREYGVPDTVGWCLEFNVNEIRKQPTVYGDLLDVLNSDEFPLKQEYRKAREYHLSLVKKQTPTGPDLFDLF
ncbi:MAG: NACHT domain-containing protein [Christensenellaceae bacterium]|nr:NACHT domain-containing protein [Christensenellaceae bacterium]